MGPDSKQEEPKPENTGTNEGWLERIDPTEEPTKQAVSGNFNEAAEQGRLKPAEETSPPYKIPDPAGDMAREILNSGQFDQPIRPPEPIQHSRENPAMYQPPDTQPDIDRLIRKGALEQGVSGDIDYDSERKRLMGYDEEGKLELSEGRREYLREIARQRVGETLNELSEEMMEEMLKEMEAGAKEAMNDFYSRGKPSTETSDSSPSSNEPEPPTGGTSGTPQS